MAQINEGSETEVPQVLRRFRDAVGVGRLTGPKIEEGRLQLYRWVASSRGDVLRTGTLIGPWLSRAKRKQFRATVGLRFGAVAANSAAWAAGLYDAEGSTSLRAHRSHTGFKLVEASITPSSSKALPQELVRFRDLANLGSIYGPYAQDGALEPLYRWECRKPDEIRRVMHLLQPWLGSVKRAQAFEALAFVGRQQELPRGRVEWGWHKDKGIDGHEYAVVRIRRYKSRGKGVEPRASKQCGCVRARAGAPTTQQLEMHDRRPQGRRSWSRSRTNYVLNGLTTC